MFASPSIPDLGEPCDGAAAAGKCVSKLGFGTRIIVMLKFKPYGFKVSNRFISFQDPNERPIIEKTTINRTTNASVDTDVKDIDSIIEPADFERSSNRILECIALNTTSKEVTNGRFSKFVYEVEKTRPSLVTKSIVFCVFLNNSDMVEIVEKELKPIYSIFKHIFVVSFDFDEYEDMYIWSPPPGKTCGKYGFVSGPYCLFMKTMECCDVFNTTLLIETDCILNENWVENLYNYTKYAGGFWISGATYDGWHFLEVWKDRSVFAHLNGVALYATGNTDFQAFLKLFETYFVYAVKHIDNKYSYDHCMRSMIDHFLEKRPTEYYWRFVERQMIRNSFIINCSTVDDSNMLGAIKKIYDHAIIHIK
jgi:hypothetical protein